MRIQQIKEKKLERVTIPQNIVNFFKTLSIDIANKEEYTQIESDDLIQPGLPETFIYGGLWDKNEDCYYFVYHPDEENGNQDRWEFNLTSEQVHKIAKGELKTLDLWACMQDGCQCKSMNKNDTCFRHDYSDDGKPDPTKPTPEEIKAISEEKRKLLEKWKENN